MGAGTNYEFQPIYFFSFNFQAANKSEAASMDKDLKDDKHDGNIKDLYSKYEKVLDTINEVKVEYGKRISRLEIMGLIIVALLSFIGYMLSRALRL
jgi:hypothetical protein